MFIIALGVTIGMHDPPREIEHYIWVMPLGALAFGIPAIISMVRRRRGLRLVRHGDRTLLVIDRDGITLEFPLECHGAQRTFRIRGIPMYEVDLQLVGADGRGAVRLRETRGAIHGPQEGWFENDLDPSVPSASYDVGGAGTLLALYDRVMNINDELAARAPGAT